MCVCTRCGVQRLPTTNRQQRCYIPQPLWRSLKLRSGLCFVQEWDLVQNVCNNNANKSTVPMLYPRCWLVPSFVVSQLCCGSVLSLALFLSSLTECCCRPYLKDHIPFCITRLDLMYALQQQWLNSFCLPQSFTWRFSHRSFKGHAILVLFAFGCKGLYSIHFFTCMFKMLLKALWCCLFLMVNVEKRCLECKVNLWERCQCYYWGKVSKETVQLQYSSSGLCNIMGSNPDTAQLWENILITHCCKSEGIEALFHLEFKCLKSSLGPSLTKIRFFLFF